MSPESDKTAGQRQLIERSEQLSLRSKELIEQSRAAIRTFQTAKQRCEANGVGAVRKTPQAPFLKKFIPS
jgi:hypothetical protein